MKYSSEIITRKKDIRTGHWESLENFVLKVDKTVNWLANELNMKIVSVSYPDTNTAIICYHNI